MTPLAADDTIRIFGTQTGTPKLGGKVEGLSSVRTIRLSADGHYLFALGERNDRAPSDRSVLEIFELDGEGRATSTGVLPAKC